MSPQIPRCRNLQAASCEVQSAEQMDPPAVRALFHEIQFELFQELQRADSVSGESRSSA